MPLPKNGLRDKLTNLIKLVENTEGCARRSAIRDLMTDLIQICHTDGIDPLVLFDEASDTADEEEEGY